MTTRPTVPNDDRSNTKNPNNPAHEADRLNRVQQGHPSPPASQPVVAPKQQPGAGKGGA